MRRIALVYALVFVLSVSFGFVLTPQLAETVHANEQCGGLDFCNYIVNCSRVFSSCPGGACGGGPCEKIWDGTCDNSGACCGAVIQTCCGGPC